MKYKKWECIVCGLIYDEELDSTNDYLIEFANPNEYCLCVAESQKKGRGRNLKKWQSPKYENIYMSLSFSTNQELKNFSSFSLVSALAVHNILMRQNIFTEIKWPNDIYLNKKKIGENTMDFRDYSLKDLASNIQSKKMSATEVDQERSKSKLIGD